MPAKRIIACLDVRHGRVVKGVQFRSLRDAGDAATCAKRYCDQGIDELVMLDVAATLEGRLASLETVERIAAAIDVPLTVGGGVRNDADAVALLNAGADKVALNSAAANDPGCLRRLSARYGAQCVVLSVDARCSPRGYEATTHSATRAAARDALEWARDGERLGAGEVLLTIVDRDGARSGYDLEAIAQFTSALGIPVIASGGARDADSFADALLAGADAALGASVFHDGTFSAAEVKERCLARGIEVRP